jgi:hypothetical protein
MGRLPEKRSPQERVMRDERMKADRRTAREEVEPEREMKTMAYQKMEARLEEEKEPTSVDRKPEVAKKRRGPHSDAGQRTEEETA